MSTQTLHSPAPFARGLAPILGLFAAFGRALAMAGDAQARFDRVQRLQSLSDAELSERGLTRDGIVRHVYADLMAI